MSDSYIHPGRKPSRAALVRGLTQVLAGEVETRGPFKITHRRANPRASTYLADVVRVRFADGSSEDLLCKYSDGVEPPPPHRGLEYEATVYDRVLRHAPVEVARYRGHFVDADTGGFVLVMRFHAAGMSAAQASELGGVMAAVRWMADFHTWAEPRVTTPDWRFLTRYDADYYLKWLDRTCELARPRAADYPWLELAAAAYRDRIPLLVARRPTCVHGEFTARNSLWADGQIMPIDWETAAIGPGEIDLALFTYDWELEELQEMEAEYVAHRWQGTPPADFADTMLAARLYVSLHWIFSNWSGKEETRVRNHLEGLQDEAVRLGVIPPQPVLP